ncbi:unnamed protein product [Amaranthus hypochondriacus]
MATDGPGSLSGQGFRVQSLPPPRPKSPPDLYGRRREMVRLQVIEREKSFLEEELKLAHRLPPASRCCKEIVDFVAANADPLLPTNQKSSKPCRFWKWLCGSSCFNLSWLCCCTGCSDCTLNLKPPQCCSCGLSDCCSCIQCSLPKCSCWCSNPCSCICPENPCRGNCKTCGSCCSFKSLPCFDCCSCKCNCSCPKCPTCSELCICDCNCNCSCPKCPSCSDLCNCNCKCRTCSDLCNCKCSCPKVPSCSDICNSCLGCITNCCCCEHCCICC